MILLLPFLLQAAPVLTDIGRQTLPASGCAAYLWQTGSTPKLVAMAAPETLRLGVDGRTVTLARTAVRGDARLGLPASADYAGEGVTATLDMAVVPQPDLADGARVPQATVSVARAGGDTAVEPLAGLAACTMVVR